MHNEEPTPIEPVMPERLAPAEPDAASPTPLLILAADEDALCTDELCLPGEATPS